MLMVVATVISIDAVKVKAKADPAFDFSRLSTWSWNPTPGSVKVVLTADSKSEPVQRRYEPVIMQAVGVEPDRAGTGLLIELAGSGHGSSLLARSGASPGPRAVQPPRRRCRAGRPARAAASAER